jgi:hypothetical protein
MYCQTFVRRIQVRIWDKTLIGRIGRYPETVGEP